MKTWTTMDKSSWPRGLWDSEPDKAQWTDEATGLPCLIVRSSSGALCGYVGVAEGHPFFGTIYHRCPEPEPCRRDGELASWCDHQPQARVEVHGGLTFSSFCKAHDPGNEGRGICHVPEPGQPDRVWWLGFDCAHDGDLSPAYDWHTRETYRTLDFVRWQCRRLAEQLAAVRS